MSKLNHSCLANASKSLFVRDLSNKNNNNSNDDSNPYSDMIEKEATGIHALRDISKGEEITIFYDPRLAFLPTNQRRPQIKQRFKFDCQCVRCIHTDNFNNNNKTNKKVKKSKKNSKKNNNTSNNNNKRLQQEIAQAKLIEKLLKGAQFPTDIANNKSAKNKYIETMKKQFSEIDKLFQQTKTAVDSIKTQNQPRENVVTIVGICAVLTNLINNFLDTYENTFLCSTHWHIIKIKRLADYSFRYYGGIVNTGLQQIVQENYFYDRLSIAISLMNSEHKLLIENLKYSYFDQMLCNDVQNMDGWLRTWKSMHYNKSIMENDENKKYLVENGNDLLTQGKEKLSCLANTDGTAIKCFVDSAKVLIIDQSLITKFQMFKFAKEKTNQTKETKETSHDHQVNQRKNQSSIDGNNNDNNDNNDEKKELECNANDRQLFEN